MIFEHSIYLRFLQPKSACCCTDQNARSARSAGDHRKISIQGSFVIRINWSYHSPVICTRSVTLFCLISRCLATVKIIPSFSGCNCMLSRFNALQVSPCFHNHTKWLVRLKCSLHFVEQIMSALKNIFFYCAWHEAKHHHALRQFFCTKGLK